MPEVRHLVHPELLAAAAQAQSVTPEVAAQLNDVLKRAAQDSDLILCTCSTLGAVAESFAEIPVLRVDRPMAARASQIGGRVVVLAALESTLIPTEALLKEEISKVSSSAELRLELCKGAWSLFEAGDLEAYHRQIAACLETLAVDADVLVLAQASMAGALKFTMTDTPILSSPELGLNGALERLTPS